MASEKVEGVPRELNHGYFKVHVKNTRNKVNWTMGFLLVEQAELYIQTLLESKELDWAEIQGINWTKRLSSAEIADFAVAMGEANAEAHRLENAGRERTVDNRVKAGEFPCEVCGKPHLNYNCCELCNLDGHTCHFCGDYLGHSEISACYIMLAWEEKYAREKTLQPQY